MDGVNHTLGTGRCAWAFCRRWCGVFRLVPKSLVNPRKRSCFVLSFRGEANGRVLSVEVIQEIVHVVTFYDGEGVSSSAMTTETGLPIGAPSCCS